MYNNTNNNNNCVFFLCSIPKHYKLAMHIFGLLACCSTLKEMDEVLLSSTVLFCSLCNGPNVAKHYNNLQLLMQQSGTFELDDKNIIAEDYKVINNVPIGIFFSTWPHSYNTVNCRIKTKQTCLPLLNLLQSRHLG